MVENTVKHSSSCLMYPEAEGVQVAHEWPCEKLQAFRGWSAFSGLWLKFYTLQAQNIPFLAWLVQPLYTTGKNTSFGSF